MLNATRSFLLLASLLPTAALAQQTPPPATLPAVAPSVAAAPATSAPDRNIRIDVVVADKSGAPVGGLEQKDFTLLDNSTAEPMTSFKAISMGQGPVEVILLMDAVNTRFDTVAYERDQVEKFLRAGDAKMPHPMTIAFLTDKGVQIQKGFSKDGNVLAGLVDGYAAGLRQITRSAGYWGATERLQISLTAIRELTAYAKTLPGRKIIIWISPGWPLLSGVRQDLDNKQQAQIFKDIVFFSNEMRDAKLTLYNINPRGVGEPLLRADYYQEFVKGIRKPSQTQIGNLGLQVLAVQSGGLALESSNDIASSLSKCIGETESWYEMTLSTPPAEQPNEYHHLEIKVDKAGLTARTRDGYYAQPEPRQ
jgi:VWFA-related protein